MVILSPQRGRRIHGRKYCCRVGACADLTGEVAASGDPTRIECLSDFLRDLPAGPDADDAAEAAQHEAAEELEAEQLAEIPEDRADDERADEDAELVHGPRLGRWHGQARRNLWPGRRLLMRTRAAAFPVYSP